MIDNILIIKKTLSDDEILNIVRKAELQKIVIGTKCTYNNFHLKNLGAIKIQIGANKSLKIICSLHKLYNFYDVGKLINYNHFSMEKARSTLIKLISDLGLNESGILISSYEIGLNIPVKNDCINYLNKFHKIGDTGKEKLFYINPKYKAERCITTIIHRDLRKSYKVYDKGYEMADKRRKEKLSFFVLRIETTFKRCESLTLQKFSDPLNLEKIKNQFFTDWNNVKFHREIIVPKGTNQNKKQLYYDLLYKGVKVTESTILQRFENGYITDRQKKYIISFIVNEWNEFKHSLRLPASKEETEIRDYLSKKQFGQVLSSLKTLKNE
ncbi:hypothetical protein ACTS95_14825 [Empedobacter brevis]